MRKSFKLEDLDCANCAAKMQDAISELPGVEKCTVNFMMAKMTLVADDDRFEEILDEAQKAIHKFEPDCNIVR